MAETRPEHLMNGAGGTGGIQVNDRISEITACVIRFLSLTFLVPSRTVRSLRVWSSPPSSPVASLLSVRYGNEVSDVRSERETVPFGCARLTTLCSHFPHSTLFTRRLVVDSVLYVHSHLLPSSE